MHSGKMHQMKGIEEELIQLRISDLSTKNPTHRIPNSSG